MVVTTVATKVLATSVRITTATLVLMRTVAALLMMAFVRTVTPIESGLTEASTVARAAAVVVEWLAVALESTTAAARPASRTTRSNLLTAGAVTPAQLS